ncbi:MAG: ATP-binding protein [Polyangiaceae bacterium]|nr:ATP-binding protein [Polyangiaceae bacterium]
MTASYSLGRAKPSQTRTRELEESPGTGGWLLTVLWLAAGAAALGLALSPEVLKKPEVVTLERPYSVLSVAAVALATGLPLYPFFALIQAWQCRQSTVRAFTLERIDAFAASLWQTFAYPLPGIRTFLRHVAEQRGPDMALAAAQKLLGTTLQTSVTSKAVVDLAKHRSLGLAFSAQVATETNAATLLSLGLSSRLAAALAVVAGRASSLPSRAVMLCLPLLPSPRPQPPSYGTRRIVVHEELLRAQGLPLANRVDLALAELGRCAECEDVLAFRSWLQAIQRHLQVSTLAQYMPAYADGRGAQPAIRPEWLAAPWLFVDSVEHSLARLEQYRLARTVEARREILLALSSRLKAFSTSGLPWLWVGVAQELIAHWTGVIEAEIADAREWLALEIELPEQRLRAGRSLLRVKLTNPTSSIAQRLSVVLDETPNIHFGAAALQEHLLEARQSIQRELPLTCEEPGDYLIQGRLEASDIEDVPFRKPFSFQIHVGRPGRPYERVPAGTYPTGPGVHIDRAFVGRADVLDWLGSVWGTPDSKEAVVLIGQRRIGKSSILHAIERRGLEGTDLLRARVDVQGTKGPHDFLSEVADAFARAARLSAPSLDPSEPFPEFKRFVRGLGDKLGGRRALLMIDEADLLEKRVGDSVLGLMRALMQDPAYPVVLLFCGTHRLRHMGHHYQSILFNTARERTVSYMSREESAEVLRRPVGDQLEFDPAALDEAFRVTGGQPYLLQCLGGEVVEHLNQALDQGKTPDNFVDLQDMVRAAEAVGKRDNAAFENYWLDRSGAQRRVLSGLASVPETIRVGRTIADLDQQLQSLGMELPRSDLVTALQELVAEEFLRSEDGHYDFGVPLFHRWIAEKHRPEIVRELPI